LCIKVTKQYSISAAENDYLHVMERVLSTAKELGKEISDEYFGEALYQIK